MSMPAASDLLLFRRMVIALQGAPGAIEDLAMAARFAQLFKSELLGIFVEDVSLIEWSASPIARHFSRVSAASSSVSPETLSRDFSAAASIARRRLLRVATTLGLTMRFEVNRVTAPSLDLDVLEPGDLLAVVEPADPMTRLSYPFTAVLRAIIETALPVLYIPHGAVERSGPIVSVIARQDEDDQQLVERIAQFLDEELIVPPNLDFSAPPAETSHERLIVMDRQAPLLSDLTAFSAILAKRRVPALLIGLPRRPMSSEESEDLN